MVKCYLGNVFNCKMRAPCSAPPLILPATQAHRVNKRAETLSQRQVRSEGGALCRLSPALPSFPAPGSLRGWPDTCSQKTVLGHPLGLGEAGFPRLRQGPRDSGQVPRTLLSPCTPVLICINTCINTCIDTPPLCCIRMESLIGYAFPRLRRGPRGSGQVPARGGERDRGRRRPRGHRAGAQRALLCPHSVLILCHGKMLPRERFQS